MSIIGFAGQRNSSHSLDRDFPICSGFELPSRTRRRTRDFNSSWINRLCTSIPKDFHVIVRKSELEKAEEHGRVNNSERLRRDVAIIVGLLERSEDESKTLGACDSKPHDLYTRNTIPEHARPVEQAARQFAKKDCQADN